MARSGRPIRSGFNLNCSSGRSCPASVRHHNLSAWLIAIIRAMLADCLSLPAAAPARSHLPRRHKSAVCLQSSRFAIPHTHNRKEKIMNIPLLHELQHEGFHQLWFTPPYDPLILVLDKESSKGVGSVKLEKMGNDEPKKGVFVLVEPLIETSKSKQPPTKYNIYVGYAGVEKDQTLYRRIQHLRSDPNINDIDNWEKAILICNWENDIISEKEGNFPERHPLISEVIHNEAVHLSIILHKRLEKEKNPKWNIVGRKPDSYYMPNPDSLRYQYYVVAVMQLLRKLTEDNIDLSGSNK